MPTSHANQTDDHCNYKTEVNVGPKGRKEC